MRSLLVLPLAAIIAACSVSSDGVAAEAKPSGKDGARDFALSGFDKIAVAGPDDVVVQVGPAASVKAEGDTGMLDQLEIKVDGSTLEIGRKRNGIFGGGGGKAVKITVTLPSLRGTAQAGSGDISVDTVKGGDFDASIAGSGSLRIASLTGAKVDASIAGAGDIRIGGTAEALDLSIAGSGNFDGLTVKTADISIAGSGNVKANVSDAAKVNIIGSGDVEIAGNAKCDVTKMGSGDVRCAPAPAAAAGQ